ncbi:DNA primase [Candidatus Dependentiae bacterium]|nr:DNA primase [Candidatus Dependentiae bacterium]
MNLFNSIKQKVSILALVSEYTTLKKAGLYWKGSCPFHHEKTASFTVSPHKEIFYCFGCQHGGDVITFVAKAENCTPLEAAQQLAERYSIDIPQDTKWTKADTSQEDKKRYILTCTVFARWCHMQLRRTITVLEYLHARHFTKKSITDFCLGFMPLGPVAVKELLAYGQKEALLAQDFITAKILLEGKNGLYCPFEDRILFPIKDLLGRFCGFGGRVYKQEDERAKYYNSHDHAFFNKGSLVFGLDSAKKSIQEQNTVFLVEGYTDAITMVQHGFINTVATLGTSCTLEHLKQLARYANTLYVLYDGDAAGQKAIMRLTELCWQVNMDLFVIILPPQEDPASFLTNKGNLKDLIEQARDIFLFFIHTLGSDFASKSLQERITQTKKLVDMIKHLEDPLKQDLLLKQAATIFDIPFATFKQELTRVQQEDTTRKVTSLRAQEQPETTMPKKELPNELMQGINKISQLEKKLFSGILSNKELLTSHDKELLKAWLPKPLNILFEKLITGSYYTFFDTLTYDEKTEISRLIIEAEDEENSRAFEELLTHFLKKRWKMTVHHVKLKIEQAQKTGNNELVQKLLTYLETLKKKMLLRGIV